MLRRNGYVTSRNLSSRLVPVETLKPLGRESRKHPASQIRKLGESIEQFGFVLPIIVDTADRVVAGWGLVLAARRLKLSEIPAVTIVDLDEARLLSLRLALNRLGEDSSWDPAALSLEFSSKSTASPISWPARTIFRSWCVILQCISPRPIRSSFAKKT